MKATAQSSGIFSQISLQKLAPEARARCCFRDNGEVFWNILDAFQFHWTFCLLGLAWVKDQTHYPALSLKKGHICRYRKDKRTQQIYNQRPHSDSNGKSHEKFISGGHITGSISKRKM